jgi:hypothetical protein
MMRGGLELGQSFPLQIVHDLLRIRGLFADGGPEQGPHCRPCGIRWMEVQKKSADNESLPEVMQQEPQDHTCCCDAGLFGRDDRMTG